MKVATFAVTLKFAAQAHDAIYVARSVTSSTETTVSPWIADKVETVLKPGIVEALAPYVSGLDGQSRAETRESRRRRPDAAVDPLSCVMSGCLVRPTSVASLDLASSGLSGTLPAALGSLTQLTTLDLHENELSGTVLAELGSLTQLTTLSLSSTSVHGDTAQLRAAVPGLSTPLFTSCEDLSGGCTAGALLPYA